MSDKHPQAGSRVAIYSRYSTNLQNESSIEGQELLCEKYAKERDWIVVDRYADKALSGTKIEGRNGLLNLRAGVAEGRYDVVLVEAIDRLSRDAADIYALSKELDLHNVTFVTVSDGVVGLVHLGVAAIQNSLFIKANTEKCKRGQELVVSQGRVSGGVTYGYRKVLREDGKGHLINGLREIHPERAAVVRRIHEEFDAGKSTLQICKTLNKEGIPSPGGKAWRPGVLLGNKRGNFGILRNTIYIGQYHFRKSTRQSVNGVLKMAFTPVSGRIVQERPDMRIVPQDVWDRNQHRLSQNIDREFYQKDRNYYVFTGKVRCGECGHSCIVSGGKYICTGRTQHRVCNNQRRVFREHVEEAIFDRLKTVLFETLQLEPCIDAYRDEVEKARAEANVSRKAARERLNTIEREMTNIVGQLKGMSEGSFAAAALKEELEKLGGERAKLDATLRLQSTEAPPVEETEVVIERISKTVTQLRVALESDDKEAVRARGLLGTLIDKVILSPKPGTKVDGRGAGDITIRVEGSVAALVNLSGLEINRVTKDSCGPSLILDNAKADWSFEIDYSWVDPRLSIVLADLPYLEALLDAAVVPVTVKSLSSALEAATLKDPNLGEGRSADQRARNLFLYTEREEITRYVRAAKGRMGYVWAGSKIADEEWIAATLSLPMA